MYLHRPHNHLWYEGLNKSALTPPPFVISLLWIFVYGCMGYSTYLHVVSSGTVLTLGFGLMLLQVLLIYVWYTLFFVKKRPRWAICVTLALLLLTFWSIH